MPHHVQQRAIPQLCVDNWFMIHLMLNRNKARIPFKVDEDGIQVNEF